MTTQIQTTDLKIGEMIYYKDVTKHNSFFYFGTVTRLTPTLAILDSGQRVLRAYNSDTGVITGFPKHEIENKGHELIINSMNVQNVLRVKRSIKKLHEVAKKFMDVNKVPTDAFNKKLVEAERVIKELQELSK